MQCRYDVALGLICLLLPLSGFAQNAPTPTPTAAAKISADLAPRPMGYLNAFVGALAVTSQGKTVTNVKPGINLFKGDTITTSTDATAELFLFDSGLVHLQANSRLMVAEMTEPKSGKIQRLLRLLEGSCRGVFEKLHEPVNLETPTTIAGIRGTRFILTAQEVAVLEGEVEVADRKNPQQAFLLNSGERVAGEFKKQEIPLNDLANIDRRYDFPIVEKQTPFVVTQQQWAAQVAKQLDFKLPKGMSAYPASTYLDLLSPPDEAGMGANNFKSSRQPQNLSIDQSKQGDTVVVASKGDVTLAYQISVPVDGVYAFEASTAGGPQYWSVEGVPTLVSGGSLATVNNRVGPFPLLKGIYGLDVSIPAGGKLGSFKLQGPPFKGFAPQEGWQKDRVLRYQQMLESLVKILAVDSENKNYSALAAELAKRGFILRGATDFVRGEDANVNAALLRKKRRDAAEDLRKRRKKPADEERDPHRSHVSPVLPGNIVEQ